MGGLSAVLVIVPLLAYVVAVQFQSSGDPAVVPGAEPEGDRPNILLIVLDTARKSNLSLYGHSRETTPNIDRFAQGALVYENAFAIAPWTIPNHASMFTGQYACQHGATQESKLLAPEAITLAELLRQEGYETAGIVNNVNVSKKRGFSQGFGYFLDLWKDKKRRRFERNADVPEGDHGAFATKRALLKWYDGKRDPMQPWFVFLNYIEVHSPYKPATPYQEALAIPETPRGERIEKYDYVDYIGGKYQMSRAAFEAAEGLYDAELRYLDEQIGELLTALEMRGALEDALIIITSDHGEMFGEHDLPGHQFTLYDTLLRVPLIVKFPGADAPTGRTDTQVELVDLFSTVLAIAGVEEPDHPELPIESRNFAAGAGRSALYAEYYRPLKYLKGFKEKFPDLDRSPWDRRIRSVRTDRHKLIWSSDGRHELYDMLEDPEEQHDIAGQEPERTTKLAQHVEQWLLARSGGAGEPVLEPEPEVSEAMKEELRALGYVE